MPAQGEFQVFSHRHRIIQGIALKKEPHFRPYSIQVIVVQVRYIFPKHPYPPAIRMQQPDDTLDQHGFTAPGFTQHHYILLFPNHQVEIIQDHIGPKAFANMFNHNDLFHFSV
jgi:hypothetical protein